MTIIKWIIVVLAVMNYGFMAFDGVRSLTVGDYVRPQSGEYAGQLGPWSKLVKAIGIEPESNLMKGLFVLWGVLGCVVMIGFALDLEWAWKGMLILSISSLWYLVPGAALSLIQIILLLVYKYYP